MDTIEAGPSAPALETGDALLARPYTPRAPLVNQVDADNLDDGIAELLADGVERAVCRFRPSIAPDFKPEIVLAVKLLIFSAGVIGPKAASPGAALQNLQLYSSRHSGRPPRTTLLLYLVLHPPLLPRYLLTRARDMALSRQWPDLPAHDRRRKAWNWIVRAENMSRAWELAGWTWFLLDGRYPSLLMRMLGLRLIPSAPRLARMVSYEFMNRQLVWGVMTEFLMFALPRIPSLPPALNPGTLLAPVTAFFSQPTSIDYEALSASAASVSAAKRAGTAAPAAAHAGACARIPLQTCPVCYLRRVSAPVTVSGTDIELPSQEETGDEDPEDRVFLPAQTDCWGGCRYCYYCIADELAKVAREKQDGGDGKWTCLRCGGAATRAWRVGAEVRSEASSEKTSESEGEISDEGKGFGVEDSWVAV